MAAIDQNTMDTSIESAVKTTLENDEWIGDSDNIKTIETGFRERAFSGEYISEGFTSDELPAIMIRAGLEVQDETPQTTCEIDVTIPVAIIAICRSEDVATCQSLIKEIKDRIVAVMRKQRDSVNHLGTDGALVLSVKATVDYEQEGAGNFYGMAYITVRIQVNVPAN